VSYFAAFVAGVLALLSIALGTGAAALVAALVAAAFILTAVGLWVADHHEHVESPAPPRIHTV
jgi:hypothetical protein